VIQHISLATSHYSLSPIYAICDFELLQKNNLSLEQYIKICEKQNVSYIQYRDKTNNIKIQKQNLLYLKSNTNIPIIINDYYELVEFCDGCHLGQEDILKRVQGSGLRVKEEVFGEFREKYSGKIIGLSTHNEEEILEANTFDLDYIGLGAFRSTNTKDVTNILGKKIEKLALISKHKVVAIGGIKLDDDIKNVDYVAIGSGLVNVKL
jgi:thiamine-phosphate pyrophosphorylase